MPKLRAWLNTETVTKTQLSNRLSFSKGGSLQTVSEAGLGQLGPRTRHFRETESSCVYIHRQKTRGNESQAKKTINIYRPVRDTARDESH